MKSSRDLAKFLLRGRRRQRIIEALSKRPETPSVLAADLRMSLSNVCKSLKELKSKGLIEPVGKQRTYQDWVLTPTGKRAMRESQELKTKIRSIKK